MGKTKELTRKKLDAEIEAYNAMRKYWEAGFDSQTKVKDAELRLRELDAQILKDRLQKSQADRCVYQINMIIGKKEFMKNFDAMSESIKKKVNDLYEEGLSNFD